MKPFTHLDTLVRPLIITALMGCLMQAVVQLGELLVPDWNGTYLGVIATLAAFVASLSYVAARRRFMSGTDLLGYNMVELGLFLIALRIGRYWGRWELLPIEARTWATNPMAFLDFELVFGFILTLISWLIATQTAQDFRDIVDPADVIDPQAPPPRPFDRLADRLAVGGFFLLALSGINRIGLVGLRALNSPDRPRVTGIIGGVLLYYALSLVLLAQAQYELRRRDWEGRKLTVTPALTRRWTVSSLVFLGVAAFIAFLIPTGQTMPLLTLIRSFIALIAGVLNYLTALLAFLIYLFFSALMKLFAPHAVPPEEVPPPELPIIEPGVMEPVQPVQPLELPWLKTLQSVGFWVLLIGGVLYLVHSYVEDRGGWGALARATRSFDWLRALLSNLRRWWRGVQYDLQARLEAQREARRQRAEQAQGPRFRRLGRTPRERILFYYLSLLYRATDAGFSRRRDQTPYEYQPRLQAHFPAVAEDIALLTDAFVAARYGIEEPTSAQERAAKAAWQRIKAELLKISETQT
ncbi:MAG: DUF4129 domain-containing protein [Fimbriimonadales bacterium]|nr:DUF4129 domain-containing protein [Fimbriimonadales bacterium]